jgi:predicted RNA-binding Zn ribbon-like protein
MVHAYTGPLRDERISIELYNTVHAVGGELVDGLGDPASARDWLAALEARLLPAVGPPGEPPGSDELIELRSVVRPALDAAVERRPVEPAALAAINAASRRAPQSLEGRSKPGGAIERVTCFHGATRADVIIGAFARDTIDLLGGSHANDLRVCGAPGCVLMFLGDHPRRAWCSHACGNRARQARHYRRTRADTAR